MATVFQSLRFITLLAISLLIITKSAAHTDLETLFTTTNTPPPQQQTLPPASDVNDQSSFFSQTAMLAPILSHLGFNELATAAPSLSTDAATTSWSGPSTLFAPSDSSLRTCFSCSVSSLLREHLVPGLFTLDYLRKLAFGTKIETLSPGRCITITSSKTQNDTISNVFIGGVEITHPDLFNNGIVIIHGIQGYISPLSPLSCDIERMTSLSFPFHPSDRGHHYHIQNQQPIVSLMLRDAILRLRNNGFSILSLAMKVKYPELMTLTNMTVFALDDLSIFSGSYTYISNVRFHIVPNHYLKIGDLERFPVGTTLPTLERGQLLTVTTAGGASVTAPLRINYVRLKVPDVMKNLRIIVHGVYLPFPHLHAAFGGMMGVTATVAGVSDGGDRVMEGECSVMDEHGFGSCGGTGSSTTVPTGSGPTGTVPTAAVTVTPFAKFSKPTVEIEDHHML